MLEVELNELEDIIKDSEEQLNHVTKLNYWHKNLNLELKSTLSISNISESNRLTTSNSFDTNYFNLSRIYIPKYVRKFFLEKILNLEKYFKLKRKKNA